MENNICIQNISLICNKYCHCIDFIQLKMQLNQKLDFEIIKKFAKKIFSL